jgi:hypothetical protein
MFNFNNCFFSFRVFKEAEEKPGKLEEKALL